MDRINKCNLPINLRFVQQQEVTRAFRKYTLAWAKKIYFVAYLAGFGFVPNKQYSRGNILRHFALYLRGMPDIKHDKGQ